MPLPAATRGAAVYGDDPTALTAVYREDTNIAVWQRSLGGEIETGVASMIASKPGFELARRVTPQQAGALIEELPGVSGIGALGRDVAELVDMFCCLFECRYAGLRLAVLSRAMCPRFHVDNVPCRLVTTYRGPATQWLPHDRVDRARLGAGSNGKPDAESGLYSSPGSIRELSPGDVALLKGELWDGNEGAGLVHRSPGVADGESRLLLTLDMVA